MRIACRRAWLEHVSVSLGDGSQIGPPLGLTPTDNRPNSIHPIAEYSCRNRASLVPAYETAYVNLVSGNLLSTNDVSSCFQSQASRERLCCFPTAVLQRNRSACINQELCHTGITKRRGLM